MDWLILPVHFLYKRQISSSAIEAKTIVADFDSYFTVIDFGTVADDADYNRCC